MTTPYPMWLKVQLGIQKAFKKLNTQAAIVVMVTGSANRYGDMKGKTPGAPVYFYAQAQSTNIQGQVEDIGWHKALADIKVTAPLNELVRVGLATITGTDPSFTFTIGDRLFFQGDTFEIRAVQTLQPSLDGLPLLVIIEGIGGVS